MNNMIKNHRSFVANQIEKSFDSGISVSQQLDIEKAEWKVGDEKQYQGATWVVGGFNAKGVPLWRKKKDSGAAASGNHQNTGDPLHVSAMVDILKKKFPNVAEFVHTGKSTITAKDSNGNEIATIDLSDNKTSTPALQTFIDKCRAAVKVSDKKTKKIS